MVCPTCSNLCIAADDSYAFYVVSRVSDGDLRPVMPDFSEMSDLARPLSLAFLAFVISWTPFFAAMYGLGLTRPAADPQPLAWLLVVWPVCGG